MRSVQGDRVVVDVEAAIGCARCAAGRGCGAGLLGADGQLRSIEIACTDSPKPQPGESVEIEMAPARLLRAACIVYGLPLGFAVGGAGAAWWLGLGDLTAALTALTGLSAGFWLARWRLRHDACLRELTPQIKRL